MTEQNYTLERGIIRNPGKFESEPSYAPYFWERSLDSGSDHTLEPGTLSGYPTDLFKVTREDRHLYPSLAGVFGVAIWETDQGFVYTEILDAATYDLLVDLDANETVF